MLTRDTQPPTLRHKPGCLPLTQQLENLPDVGQIRHRSPTRGRKCGNNIGVKAGGNHHQKCMVGQPGTADEAQVNRARLPSQDAIGKHCRRTAKSKLPGRQVLRARWRNGKRNRSASHFGSQRSNRSIAPHRHHRKGANARGFKVGAGGIKWQSRRNNPPSRQRAADPLGCNKGPATAGGWVGNDGCTHR